MVQTSNFPEGALEWGKSPFIEQMGIEVTAHNGIDTAMCGNPRK